MFISNTRPGQNPLENIKRRVMNRCGSTALKIGDVVAFDLDASATETQNLKGVRGETVQTLATAMFSNVVEVGAAPVNAWVAVVVDLLDGDGADNTEVEVQLCGEVQAKVGGTNWSSSYASCGVALMADTTGANRRLVAATDGANTGKVGMIGEDIAENLSASNKQLTTVFLLGGFGSSVGSVGA